MKCKSFLSLKYLGRRIRFSTNILTPVKGVLAFFALIIFLGLGTSCKPKNNTPGMILKEGLAVAKVTDSAQQIVDQAINAHGGDLYDKAQFAFTFRDKRYTFKNSKESYTYTVTSKKEGKTVQDQLVNGRFTRTVDGEVMQLSDKDIAKYSEALNSVVYFATLPHKLNDAAVLKSYEGTTVIHGKPYAVLGITFRQEGGGKDFDDEFHYWINQETNTVDYLAYNYSTNGGGVRFRAAYSPMTVGGIRFQDYINYKAPIGTPLKELPILYENGDLEELSRIITEDVAVLSE